MDLLYYKSVEGNFGDDMNAWFWDEAFPEYRSLAPDRVMLGIGSVLSADTLRNTSKVLVMGSGAGIGPMPQRQDPRLDYGFVRGPLTVRALGLAPDRAIADPACLTPRLPSFAAATVRTHETIFIPHTSSLRLDLDWRSIAGSAGMTLVSPRTDSREVITQIASAARVVTESMHGAIVADAFRVPWTLLAIAPNFNMFKFLDWGGAVGVRPQVQHAFPLATAALLAARETKSMYENFRLSGRLRRPGQELHPSFGRTGDIRNLAGRIPRSWYSRLESALVRSLRQAVTRPAQLSSADMLRQRQDQMFWRIDEIRNRLMRE